MAKRRPPARRRRPPPAPRTKRHLPRSRPQYRRRRFPPRSPPIKADKTVVLLVVHDGGIEDGLVARAVERLKSDSGLAVFVVPARRIARYAAITLGVDVEQVPALIVMRPRRLSGGTPQASLSYGFQTPQSVVQAVRDASYKGPEVAYHPN